MKKTKEMMEATHKRNYLDDWNYEDQFLDDDGEVNPYAVVAQELRDKHKEFDKLLKEMYKKYPEEMEDAHSWVRQVLLDAAFDATVEKYSDAIDELAKR